jgi:pimeloyl-ACP methyl ester carboxylesterase
MNQPVHISVREKASGGPVAPSVTEEGGHLDGNDRVLILVHGYNNSFTDALDNYGVFFDHLAANFATYIGQTAEFFWPGDSPLKMISILSYPNQIEPAIESAQRLSVYLWNLKGARNGPMEVSLVGHSLGCRVVLELLALWTGGMPPNIRLGAVALMAAAVMVKHVDQGGQLRAAATLSGNSLALHSQGDAVLHWAFPLGETAAGEGFFPTAVGRSGGPLQTWKQRLPMATAAGKAYGHGSYWPGDESSNAVISVLGGVPPRTIAEIGALENFPTSENSIPSRPTLVRVLAAQPAFA